MISCLLVLSFTEVFLGSNVNVDVENILMCVRAKFFKSCYPFVIQGKKTLF